MPKRSQAFHPTVHILATLQQCLLSSIPQITLLSLSYRHTLNLSLKHISSLCTLLSHSHTRTHSQSPFNAHYSHTDTRSLTVSHLLQSSHNHTNTLSIPLIYTLTHPYSIFPTIRLTLYHSYTTPFTHTWTQSSQHIKYMGCYPQTPGGSPADTPC